MRKLFVGLIVLFLCSCAEVDYKEQDQTQLTKIEQYQAKVQKEFIEDVVEVEYKGHTYLRYYGGGGSGAIGGICHSASCHCYTD